MGPSGRGKKYFGIFLLNIFHSLFRGTFDVGIQESNSGDWVFLLHKE